MVGKHNLGGKVVVAVARRKQGQQVQLHRTIPIEQFGIRMVLLQFLSFHGVRAHYLSLEVVIQRGVLGIHQRCGGIGFNRILEHAPVRHIAIDNTRSHIGGNGQKTAFGGVHDGGPCSIFLTGRTEVNTLGIPVIGAHTVVVLVVAATQGQRMLHRGTRAAHSVEPVHIATEIHAIVTPTEADVAVVLGTHHVKFLLDDIKREHS